MAVSLPREAAVRRVSGSHLWTTLEVTHELCARAGTHVLVPGAVASRTGLVRPLVQDRVRVGDRFVARADFAWPEQRLAVEYEGLWHGEHQQVASDRRRLNGLPRAGRGSSWERPRTCGVRGG